MMPLIADFVVKTFLATQNDLLVIIAPVVFHLCMLIGNFLAIVLAGVSERCELSDLSHIQRKVG